MMETLADNGNGSYAYTYNLNKPQKLFGEALRVLKNSGEF